MSYTIVNLADDRCVFKHKKFDRYYVKNRWCNDDSLEFFTTESLDEAKDILTATKSHWGGVGSSSWAIIDSAGNVVTQ